jgi:DNA modification methylase
LAWPSLANNIEVAGTTGMVADDLGRDAILIELSPDYVKMSERRIHNRDLLFAQVAVE